MRYGVDIALTHLLDSPNKPALFYYDTNHPVIWGRGVPASLSSLGVNTVGETKNVSSVIMHNEPCPEPVLDVISASLETLIQVRGDRIPLIQDSYCEPPSWGNAISKSKKERR